MSSCILKENQHLFNYLIIRKSWEVVLSFFLIKKQKMVRQYSVPEYHMMYLCHLLFSVTSKKSPNVYKSCPKMISLEKLEILTLWSHWSHPIVDHSSPLYLKLCHWLTSFLISVSNFYSLNLFLYRYTHSLTHSHTPLSLLLAKVLYKSGTKLRVIHQLHLTKARLRKMNSKKVFFHFSFNC